MVDFITPTKHTPWTPKQKLAYLTSLLHGVFQLSHVSAVPRLLQSAQPDPLLPFTARLKASFSAR